MSFWSGERLKAELPALISNFQESRVDCASYRLSVGPEAYISPSDNSEGWQARRKKILDKEDPSCVIPPGQFAFLLTEETVTVPHNAFALISMRSDPKFKGLVNVSGFHVDPGYSGRLVYSVFNAGPSAIHVERGNDWFLIFYADLDRPSEEIRKKPGYSQIPSNLINDVAGDVQSFEALKSRIDGATTKLSERIAVIERDHSLIRWATALIVGVLLTLALKNCNLPSKNDNVNPPSSTPSSQANTHQSR